MGISVQKIVDETGISESWVYELKEKARQKIEQMNKEEPIRNCILVTPRLIKRAILSLSLDCHASTEGIQRAMQNILQLHISIGTISTTIKEAAERAKEFDEKISLDKISQGANDEIFQGNTPILTGVDVSSTYVYLLEEADDRSGETWELYMSDLKDRGLELKVNISDMGTGLQSGIPRAYPDIEMQPDVFHELKAIRTEVGRKEQECYKMIEKSEQMKRKMERPDYDEKLLVQYGLFFPKMLESIKRYDQLWILYIWLVELLGFAGYTFQDTLALVKWVLGEMEKLYTEDKRLCKAIARLKIRLPRVLSFLCRLQTDFEKTAQKEKIPLEAFEMFYHQKAFSPFSNEYNQIDYQTSIKLGKDYNRARELFEKCIQQTKRASSMIENVNSRIRVFINLKRMVPQNYFVLIKVYLNTKKYRRSRVKERVGKSPIELMTGNEYPDFFTIIGY